MAIDDSLERARLHPDVLKNLNKNKKLKMAEAYSEDNPPPYPVTSVNGQTGDVDIPTVNLPVSVQDGGTGADNAADARTNLGLGDVAIENVVPLNKGGTGASNAATARANLAVPNMQTDTHPTLLKSDGSNSWIKIGKANSSYGLLPSQVGAKGSGHNHIGTAQWYWSDAYVDNYYGSWKGDTIPVDKGGTGATSAAAARTNLGVPSKTSQLTNDSKFTTLLDVYPVGSIYMSVNSTSPATLFGGTWERLKDRFLLAAGSTYSAGSTGGSSTMAHTHTISHTHNLDSNGYAKLTLHAAGGTSIRYRGGTSTWTANYRVTGGGGSGIDISINMTEGTELGGRTAGSSAANTGAASNDNNMPPYLAVYVWKRTK